MLGDARVPVLDELRERLSRRQALGGVLGMAALALTEAADAKKKKRKKKKKKKSKKNQKSGQNSNCPAGQVECDAVCRDVSSDIEHCGECWESCYDGQICSAGVCTVPCSEHACLKQKFEGTSGVSQLAIMTDGNLAAIRNGEQIDIYSSTGSRLRTIGEFGAEPGEFDGAWDVAIGANGSLYVADYFNDRIQELQPYGQVEEFSVESPEKVTVSPAGTVYFAGSSQIIRAADAAGPGYSWGPDGTDQTGFRWLSAIAVDATGDVYVVENVNNRAFRFGDIGTGIVDVKWVTSGKGIDPGEFRRAMGLTVAGDRVYVADAGGGNVHVLNAQDGVFLFKFPVTDEDGYDLSPQDIAVDGSGNVYIADGGIYVYSLKS